jgi:hypothetical protein
LRLSDGNERIAAQHLLADAASLLAFGSASAPRPGTGAAAGASSSVRWPWPEARLSYANAIVPAAALAAGAALGRDDLVEGGLDLLAWFVDLESLNGHFSFTPTGGRGPGGPQPAWDQQPIEAGAMAFACAQALLVSGDGRWRGPLWAAVEWWLGRNDAGALVFDPATAGGYDGLTRDGVNHNEGAESTIAFVGAMALAASVEGGRAQAQEARAPSSSGTEAVAAPT